MKRRLSGIAALTGLLVTLSMLGPACVVHTRGRAELVVDEAPPEPQYAPEPAPRAGHVWVRGHWEWRNGNWKWKRGYWKEDRAGYAWVPGHWERRGNRYHFVEGHWSASGSGGAGVVTRDHRDQPRVHTRDHREPEPRVHTRDHREPDPGYSGGGSASGSVEVWVDVAPPEPKAESPGSKAGYTWIPGRWEYRNGNWKWKRGRWEKTRVNHVWVPGHWQRVGNRYKWVEGHWEVAGSGKGDVHRRDHRKPARDVETVPSRRGGR